MDSDSDEERVGLLSPDRAKKERGPQPNLCRTAAAALLGVVLGYAVVSRSLSANLDNARLLEAIAEREEALE